MGEKFEILVSLTFWLKEFLYGYVPLNEVGLVSNTTNQPIFMSNKDTLKDLYQT